MYTWPAGSKTTSRIEIKQKNLPWGYICQVSNSSGTGVTSWPEFVTYEVTWSYCLVSWLPHGTQQPSPARYMPRWRDSRSRESHTVRSSLEDESGIGILLGASQRWSPRNLRPYRVAKVYIMTHILMCFWLFQRLNNGLVTTQAAQIASCLNKAEFQKTFDVVQNALGDRKGDVKAKTPETVTYESLRRKYGVLIPLDRLVPLLHETANNLNSSRSRYKPNSAVARCAIFFWAFHDLKVMFALLIFKSLLLILTRKVYLKRPQNTRKKMECHLKFWKRFLDIWSRNFHLCDNEY